MKIAGEGKLLRIFIGESDRHHGRALYEVIVRTARELGLAGATVWRGIGGYGAASRIHTAKILRPLVGFPILIKNNQTEEHIRTGLPTLHHLTYEKALSSLIHHNRNNT